MIASRSLLAATLTLALAGGAQAQTFIGGSAGVSINAISPLFGADIITLTGVSGAWSGPGAQTVGNLQLTPSSFCLFAFCSQNASGALTPTMVVGLASQTLSISWNLTMDGAGGDAATFIAPVAMDFVQPDGEVDHVVFSIATTTLTAQGPTTTTLDATVEVPEPATWAAMLLGLVGLGAMRRRETVAARAVRR